MAKGNIKEIADYEAMPTDRQVGFDAGLRAAADLIRRTQETVSEATGGSTRHLTDRKHGNLMALAYADALEDEANRTDI